MKEERDLAVEEREHRFPSRDDGESVGLDGRGLAAGGSLDGKGRHGTEARGTACGGIGAGLVEEGVDLAEFLVAFADLVLG